MKSDHEIEQNMRQKPRVTVAPPKFRTVLADPPWDEKGGGKIVRGAQKHYDVMKSKDIIALDENLYPLLHDDCHLYLWVTNGKLPIGLRVMDAWGFRYVTKIDWPKPRIGIGQYFRGKSESCLFGVRGKCEYKYHANGKRAQGSTLLDVWKNPRHSAKPPQLREYAELVSHGPRLELFGRDPVKGWTVLGDEVTGNDIRYDLDTLSGRFSD